jgi:hypothetical protein
VTAGGERRTGFATTAAGSPRCDLPPSTSRSLAEIYAVADEQDLG